MVSLHSANFTSWLSEKDVTKFHFQKEYEIYYHRTTTHLLPHPYKTNCFNYNPDDHQYDRSYQYREWFKKERGLFRGDCVDRCRLNSHLLKCKPFLPENILLRKDLLTNESIFANRHNSDRKCMFSYYFCNNECKDKCKPDCDQIRYHFDVRRKEKLNESTNSSYKITLNFHRKIFSDTVLIHSPEKSEVAIISEFGWSAEIWSGLSFLFSWFRYTHIQSI